MAEAQISRTDNLMKYLRLDQKGSIIAEYIWIDADGETRSKARTLAEKEYAVDDLPTWNFDGSSTGQAPGDNSDVYLKPVAVFADPFRGSPNILHIEAAIKKLEGRHLEHIAVYGEGNEKRLTGRHETGSIDQFSYGVATRGASIRIPRECAAKGFGYFEDRRPASNADPYRITGIMMETIYGSVN
ncbi:hypothetical protein BN1708_004203 [Verticillium longisporum]|uniref:Glutamine synthetase n=1 Tax=Verticillium longisporum TaxID=100787 RepID=A0A0G4LWZ3_VERLO|nr:hypothetical protein BN1708_004203 [Verticillium longisporum]